MKKALKYTLGALAAAVLVAPAYASFIDNTAVRAAATYTKASGDGLNYAAEPHIADFGGTSEVAIWRPVFVAPETEWDYSLGLEYRIPGSNSRVVFEYDHYRNTESRSSTALSAFGQNVLATNTNSGKVEHRENDFKMGLRHTLEFGPKFEAVLGAFLEYAKIERTFEEFFNESVVPTSFYRSSLDDVKGWGPYMDATGRTFPWAETNRCWSFWAHAGVGLLYTDHHFDSYTNSENPVGGAAGPNLHRDGGLRPETTHSMMTKVDADFGVEYSRLMKADFADMNFGVRLGVKYLNYANAFKNGNFTTRGSVRMAGIAAGALNADNMIGMPSNDYGRVGPFIEFKLGGANS